MSPDSTFPRGRAIVLGGSMAGLLAARVLADHFDTVTLVERDTLPDDIAQRRGVPQGQHTHGLLAGGSRVLDRLFPGFSSDMVRHGAVPGDIARDIRWFFEGAPLARCASGLDGLMASRPFFEAGVRARTLGLPNVIRRDGCQVGSLTFTPGRDRVTGAVLTTGETLTADLVVDATGRGSRAADWLEAAGYDGPDEDRVEIGLGYTTRFFRRLPSHLDGDSGTVVPPTPDGKRGGVMVAQEGDRWTVTLISHFLPPAPQEMSGFTWFASLLPSPDIHAVVRSAQPLGGAVTSRFPASVRRRYERLSRFPDSFVVLGDAMCSFNPIYGQGMSVAALEAVALGEIVAAGRAKIGRRFFKAAARIVDTPWMTAVGNDLRMPETAGPRSPIVNVVNGYMARLHRAAHTDQELAVSFLRVANLLAPPATLFTPRAAWRVLVRRQSRSANVNSALPAMTARY
jgi:2-polyprenyl-6-methoxyphenol hydroxylase-like FAD-dependent oxidoreductase